nr:MAG TPA: hypothetical protein [Caudoviricetes sp.]
MFIELEVAFHEILYHGRNFSFKQEEFYYE